MKEFCVDFKIAKKLKENGFPQLNGQYYSVDGIDINPAKWCDEFFGMDSQEELDNQDIILFPTTDELIKELPSTFTLQGYTHYLNINDNGNNTFTVGYSHEHTGELEWIIDNKKLNHALAKMWLYLKKEGHI